MNRGLEKRAIFLTPEDIRSFFGLLGEIHDRFGLEIHAYCLMGNHYHLIVRTPEPNLSDAMRHLDGVYTQRFNRFHDRDGPLFRGRFRSVLVQRDAHLACAVRYLHLNPVEARLVERPEEWKYSSHRAYLDPSHTRPWLFTDAVLGWFGTTGARQRLRQFIDDGIDPLTQEFFGGKRRAPVFGTVSYRDEIAKVLGQGRNRPMPEVPDALRVRVLADLDTVGTIVASAFGVTVRDMQSVGSRRSLRVLHARGAFVDIAVQCARKRVRSACEWLGYRRTSSGSSAVRRYREAVANDDTIRDCAETAIRALRDGVKSTLDGERPT